MLEGSKQSREIRRMWALLPWRAQVPFYFAVFCTFATLGFLVDALSRGGFSLASLAVLVVWSGAFAMGLAWCGTDHSRTTRRCS